VAAEGVLELLEFADLSRGDARVGGWTPTPIGMHGSLGHAQVASLAVADLECLEVASCDELAQMLAADSQPARHFPSRPALPGVGAWLGGRLGLDGRRF
jgi:hypothetical protein